MTKTVHTEGAIYLINEDEGWMQRYPRNEPWTASWATTRAMVNPCYGDGERMPLISIEQLEVGKNMWLTYRRADGTHMPRQTTYVLEIIEVP